MTLSEFLSERGLTDERFAQSVGVSRTTVLRWRNGLIPERETMSRIVEATDGEVTPNDFYGVATAHPISPEKEQAA